MKKNKGLHLIYKKVGETPLEAILRYKKENPEQDHVAMTYAGRLDPMAEGLLLVLSGDEIVNKDKFLDLPKTYEFEILWGFESDTADLLGLQVKSRKLKVESEIPEISEIKKQLRKSVGKFEQMYPIYSSRPVGGKSLFEWAREGRISEVLIPKHEVEIFHVEFLGRKKMKPKKVLEEILQKIDLVSGDFRQEEIKSLWKKSVSRGTLDTLLVDKVRIEVSSGFYVRQFVNDLSRSFKSKALTYSIKRVMVGDYYVEI
ncbi:MAG: hypothetical protein WAX44_04350 [Minisyncoccia bacterium]